MVKCPWVQYPLPPRTTTTKKPTEIDTGIKLLTRLQALLVINNFYMHLLERQSFSMQSIPCKDS